MSVVPDLVVLAQSGHAAKTDITRCPGNVRFFANRHCKSKTSCLLLTQSGNRLSSALKGFPPHWLIPKVVPMQNEISFYSDELGRKISCIYSAFGGLLTVTTPDGRQIFAIGIIKFASNSGAHDAD